MTNSSNKPQKTGTTNKQVVISEKEKPIEQLRVALGMVLILSFGGILLYMVLKDSYLSKEEKKVDNSLTIGAQELNFAQQPFTAFVLDQSAESLKLYWEAADKQPLKSIGALKKKVEASGEELVFAMNAGMFTPTNAPQGLFVADYLEQTPIDDKPKGYGNFYMMPNGVFAFDEKGAIVQERKAYLEANKQYKYATQSGPMLVIDGELHPAFREKSTSVHIRNGVGVREDGAIVFAISEVPVNLYTFATLFRDHFKCPNALYLDGAISKIYLPALEKYETTGNLGPLVAVTKPSSKQIVPPTKLTTIQSGHFIHRENSFDVYIHTLGEEHIQFLLKDKQNQPYKGLLNINEELSAAGKSLTFAMNGGSFTEQLAPKGLLINNAQELAALNLKEGKGNFYLQPNGVFAITDKQFLIAPSTTFAEIKAPINFATQSGPLLLNDGKIHPKLNKGSANVHIRNGIGLINKQQVAFVISNEPVNFYDFATFFKEVLHCKDALYLDGVNSTMYAPALGRNDLTHQKKLGPIIAIIHEK